MSEPLSSHEIEDVLSSIRRLVSEDLRPAAARVPAAAAPAAPVAPAGGKLLLTPSLRVVAEAPAPVVDAAADAAGAMPVPDQAMPAWDEYDDESQGADAPWHGEAGEFSLGRDEIIAEEPAGWADAPVGEDFAPPAAEAPFVEAPEADAEAEFWSIRSRMAETEEEADAASLPADPAPVRGHWTAETVPVPESDWMQVEVEEWPEEEPVPFVAHRRAGLTDEPLARAWAERAEAEVRAQLRGTVPPEPPRMDPPQGAGGGGQGGGGGGGSIFDAEEPMIDEEMLRDIVREIIREELAGTLGERITRNVRKLVRVEINRALTAREFE